MDGRAAEREPRRLERPAERAREHLPDPQAQAAHAAADRARVGPSLGREVALSLGLRFDRLVLVTLGLVGMLVSVSTALVGPVAFFGLLVAGLAHGLSPTARHAVLLPVAGLIGAAVIGLAPTAVSMLFDAGAG